MKNFKILITIILFSAINLLNAQKIGVVDTNYILGKLPQYQEAEARLKTQIEQWQQDIQRMQSEYDTKKAEFENEKVLLVGDLLKQRQKEVDDMEKLLKKTIEQRFGIKGEINNSRSNLVKPFQDQIWNAIQTIATKNSLGIVIDKSNDMSVIFLEKRYDYTDKVLDLLLKKENLGDTLKKKILNLTK